MAEGFHHLQRLDQPILLFEPVLQHGAELVQILVQLQQLGFVGVAVLVVELQREFGTGTDMGVDALGQLQFVPAGLLKGGDDMVVDLEMACADVIDQLFAKTLQFDVTWQASCPPSASNACLASSQSSIALCLPASARLVFSSSVNIVPPWAWHAALGSHASGHSHRLTTLL